MSDLRAYPQRPILAVSAAIFRDGKVLMVRRARKPALGVYTLPGGGVETGETLIEAVMREVREETALEIEPVALAGYREAIVRDAQGRRRTPFRHLVLCRALARRRAGAQRGTRRRALARPAELPALRTTEGLAEIVAAAFARLAAAGLTARLAIASERGHISATMHRPKPHDEAARHRHAAALPGAAGAARRRSPAPFDADLAAARRNPGRAALPARRLRRQ